MKTNADACYSALKCWILAFATLMIIITLLLLGCADGQGALRIGKKASPDDLANADAVLTQISSGSIERLYSVYRNDVMFRIAVNDQNEITYISTEDPGFETEEGISVGNRFDDVQLLTDHKPVQERGWVTFIPLNSGWNAVISAGSTMTESLPDSVLKVWWLFQR